MPRPSPLSLPPPARAGKLASFLPYPSLGRVPEAPTGSWRRPESPVRARGWTRLTSRIHFAVTLIGALGLATGTPVVRSAEPVVGRPVMTQVGLGRNVIDGPVWATTITPAGDLIVGSNRLSILSQHQWSQIALPDAHAFRGLAPSADGSRVWVGAMHQLGYIARRAPGDWGFHSLLEAWRRDTGTTLEDVWAVQATPQGAVWLTSDRAARWNGTTFTTWRARGRHRLFGAATAEGLWFYDDGHGVYAIGDRGDPQLVVPYDELPRPPVTWMIPPTATEPRPIIGMAGGAYRQESDGSFTRLHALSRALAGTLPGRAVRLPHGNFGIATFRAGVVIADQEGEVKEIINRKRGLSDNTTYTLGADGDHLWIGYQGGLARVDGVGQSYIIDRQTGLGDGAPRGVEFNRDGTWLLTSKDVLLLAPDSDQLRPVLEHETLLWSATQVGDALWVGGFGGVWRVDPTGAKREHFAPHDVLSVTASREYQSGVVYTEGYDLKALRPSRHGGWVPEDLHLRIRDTPVSLFESSRDEIWAGTMTRGIDRFAWRSDPSSPYAQLYLKNHYDIGRELPDQGKRARVVELGPRIFAFTDAGILRLHRHRPEFELEPTVREYVGIAASTDESGDTGYWLVRPRLIDDHNSYALLRVSWHSGQLQVEPLHAHGLNGVGDPVALDYGQGSLWLSSTAGVLKIDEAALTAADPVPQVQVSLRTDPGPGAPDEAGLLPLDPHVRRVDFHFAPSPSDHDQVYLQTRLTGAEAEWSPPSLESARSFAGLEPGSYRFEVRAVDSFGRTGPVEHIGFKLISPWYRRGPAIAGYVVLGLLLVGGIARWQVLRLKRKNEHLNLMVEKRTRELALSNIAKSDFLENISHEIRNPLNGLTGLLALLKEDNLGPRERELTRSLRAVSRKLMSVFEDVLSYARLEYGYVNLDAQPFRLRPLLQDAVDLFATQSREQGQSLTLHWPEGFIDGFIGDHAKIRTIIENFVGNALKYAPGAAIEIRLLNEVEPDEDPDAPVDLFIEVADHGPGIPPEEQVLVFSKFVRGSKAKRDQVTGTGLGLATCRALAQVMGGEVTLHSQVGHGSEFVLAVRLPRTHLETPAPTVASGLATATVECGRALVVEDEPYNRIVLEGLGVELGYDVDVASTAEEALTLLTRESYAVIFLDWELPRAKGVEVAHAVRGSVGGDQPIILATTAHDSDEIRRRCRQAGMDAFLLKPYDTDKVRTIIASVRSRRHGIGPPPGEPAPPAAHDRPLEPFNRQAFSHYSRSKGEQESTAIHQFTSSLDQEYETIAAALASEDYPVAKFHAHRLRALAGLIGARELNLAAKQLEEIMVDTATPADRDRAWSRTQSSGAVLKTRLHELADRN
ncbi:ATP-binding protein [Synoicihabitans lomoniglobus]|uniref:histidine kinase n=1 Tax=Synoicihabitans lomoniglobus TaxID=2909285 RepID=A0AAF0CQ47_9BACT|nr:ATP-binding protein [Opitutaceae bacterium LMO-M01]WED66005.1 ATP-binding protein [Opitutaceae bacterium LMO-M01]